jgi:hypothetical protein
MSNNAQIDVRLAALEDLVTTQQTKLRGSLRTTMIVYVVLVVVVVAYTTVATRKIVELTSPDAIAEMVGAQIKEELPRQRQALVDRLNNNAEEFAGESVEFLVRVLPKVEDQAQTMINEYTDLIVNKLQHEFVPSFAEFIKADAGNIKAQLAELSDEELAAGVVGLIMDDIEQELDKVMNDSVVAELEKLQVKLLKLAKPNATLTRSEDAQRRAIMMWAHLSETTDMGESPLKVLFDELNNRYRFFNSDDLKHLNAPLGEDLDDVRGAVAPGTE